MNPNPPPDVDASRWIIPSVSYDLYLPRLLFRYPIFLNLAFPKPPISLDNALQPPHDFAINHHSHDDADRVEENLGREQGTSRLHGIFRAFATPVIAYFQSMTSMPWQLALAGMTLHDLIYYLLHIDDRYGYSLQRILLGLAPLDAAWNYQFGSDLVSDHRYYPIVSSLLLFPFASAFARIAYHRICRLDNPSAALATIANLQGKLWDLRNTLFPWNRYTRAIEQATFFLLWDKHLPFTDQERILDALIETTQSPTGLPYMRAICALATIAEDMPKKDFGVLSENSDPRTANGRHQISEYFRELLYPPDTVFKLAALAHLQTLADQGSVLSKYELWTLNRLQQCHFKPLFWLWGLYALYAKVRAVQLIYAKSRGIYDYYTEKKACEAADKIFRCLNQIEACICALCADWAEAHTTAHSPSIYYAQSDDPQACLNALLAEKRTPQEILAALPRFLGRLPKPVSVFDGSAQDWSTWTD